MKGSVSIPLSEVGSLQLKELWTTLTWGELSAGTAIKFMIQLTPYKGIYITYIAHYFPLHGRNWKPRGGIFCSIMWRCSYRCAPSNLNARWRASLEDVMKSEVRNERLVFRPYTSRWCVAIIGEHLRTCTLQYTSGCT